MGKLVRNELAALTFFDRQVSVNFAMLAMQNIPSKELFNIIYFV